MPQRFLHVPGLVLCFGLLAGPTIAAGPSTKRELPPIPLSIDEIHAWIDRTHPLLKGAGTEKVMARGKMLNRSVSERSCSACNTAFASSRRACAFCFPVVE